MIDIQCYAHLKHQPDADGSAGGVNGARVSARAEQRDDVVVERHAVHELHLARDHLHVVGRHRLAKLDALVRDVGHAVAGRVSPVEDDGEPKSRTDDAVAGQNELGC